MTEEEFTLDQIDSTTKIETVREIIQSVHLSRRTKSSLERILTACERQGSINDKAKRRILRIIDLELDCLEQEIERDQLLAQLYKNTSDQMKLDLEKYNETKESKYLSSVDKIEFTSTFKVVIFSTKYFFKLLPAYFRLALARI
ncbi:MAG: hypothetical protein AB9897_00640 [Anaerolineaceae bacterium]